MPAFRPFPELILVKKLLNTWGYNSNPFYLKIYELDWQKHHRRNVAILPVLAHIFRRNILCKFILFISLHSDKGPLPWHIYQMIGRIHLRFLPLCKQGKQKGNNHLSKKRTMLTFNTLLLFSLAFISIRFKQIWASCIIHCDIWFVMVFYRFREKQAVQSNCVGRGLSWCFLLSAAPSQGNISWSRQKTKMVN